jgi:tetratricopeptide (TPR) repeat protein
MIDNLRAQIHHSLVIKKTEELLEIWEDEELAEWDEESYEIIREILLGRLGYLPSHLALKQIQQTIMNIEEFLEKGELDNALKECDLAIQLQPDLAIAHNYRGEIHDEREQLEEAMANYQKALQLDPELREAWENLLSIEPVLEEKFQKSSTKQYLDRALEYAYEDEPQKAMEACELARPDMPNIAVAYNYLGLIFETLNELELAINSYLKAVQFNPRFYAARENLGNSRVKLEEETYHLMSMRSQNEVKESDADGMEYEELQAVEISDDASPVPPWVYMNEKSLLLIGWPGYRNRPGRSGLDPLERNAEQAHMQVRVLILLATRKFRTRDPLYLAVMTCVGLLYCSPLLTTIFLFQGDLTSILPLIIYSPYLALGILLLINVYLSLHLDPTDENADNGYTFF